MTKYNIGKSLKQLRKISGYSMNEVVEQLKQYQINIAAKTIYGYECNSTLPNVNTFLALCHIYRCENPMKLLDMPPMSPPETDIIKKYRMLDSRGKKIVDFILDAELKCSLEANAAKEKQ